MKTRASYFIYGLVFMFLGQCLLVDADYMPAIFWDPGNPLFNCPSRDINTVLVKMGDYITLLCPVTYSHLGLQGDRVNYDALYEVAYFVHPEKKQDALNCNVTGYTALITCNRPQAVWGVSVRVAQAQGDPTHPIFAHGKTYYLVGTGNGLQTGIGNQVGGRCNTVDNASSKKTYKMILKIRVCTNDEVNVYKNCTVCKSIGCYNKGCGNYNGWREWEHYRNITNIAASAAKNGLSTVTKVVPEENQCFKQRQRDCDDNVVDCDGPSQQKEAKSCPKIKVSANYQNCSSWISLPDIYRNETTDHCFKRSYQNCTVGDLEKMDITRWKMESAKCLEKPTVVCDEWSRLNSTYTNSSGYCFSLLTRNCTLPRCTLTSVVERKLVEFPCPTTTLAITATSILSTRASEKSSVPTLVTSFAPTPSVGTSSHVEIPSSSSVLNTGSISTSKPIERCSTVVSYLPCSNTLKPSPTPTGPNTGASVGQSSESNYKSYVIPVVAAFIGIALGCIATLFFVNHKKKIHTRENSSRNYEADTEECVDAGIANNGFELGTLEKKPPISQA